MAFHGRSAGHGEPDPYLQGAPWGVSQEHHRSQDGLREAREEKQKPSVECKVLLTINEFGEFPLCHNANRKLLLLLHHMVKSCLLVGHLWKQQTCGGFKHCLNVNLDATLILRGTRIF